MYLVAYLLLGPAALHPSMAGLSEPARRRQARLGRGRLLAMGRPPWSPRPADRPAPPGQRHRGCRHRRRLGGAVRAGPDPHRRARAQARAGRGRPPPGARPDRAGSRAGADLYRHRAPRLPGHPGGAAERGRPRRGPPDLAGAGGGRRPGGSVHRRRRRRLRAGGRRDPGPPGPLRPGGDAGACRDGRRPVPARHPPRRRRGPAGHVPRPPAA